MNCPSNCWYWILIGGRHMCCQYPKTLPLNLIFLSPVSPINSSWHMSQITTYMELKLSHVKRCFCLNNIWRFLKVLSFSLPHLNLLDKFSPYSALVKFFEIGNFSLSLYWFGTMKPINVIIFQIVNWGFNGTVNNMVV